MLVAAVVVDHSFNDPFVFDFVIEVASINAFEEGSGVCIDDCSVTVLDVGL